MKNSQVIGDSLLIQEVRGDGLLQERVPDVLLVCQNFLQSVGQPEVVSSRRPDAVRRKPLPDGVVALAAKVLPVDAPHHLSFLRVYDQVSILVLIIAEESVSADLHLALLVAVLQSQPDVLGKALAFLLGKGCHYCEQDFGYRNIS